MQNRRALYGPRQENNSVVGAYANSKEPNQPKYKTSTQQINSNAETLLQRHHNVLTLRRRWNDVVATLCVSWEYILLYPMIL